MMIDLTKTPINELEWAQIAVIKHSREQIAEERKHRALYHKESNFQFVRIARRHRRGAHVTRLLMRERILGQLRGVDWKTIRLGSTRKFKIARMVG